MVCEKNHSNEYIEQVEKELVNAEEAVEIVKQLLSGCEQSDTQCLKRKEVSKALDISMDTLRNWEMNGLLTVKRKENGYFSNVHGLLSVY